MTTTIPTRLLAAAAIVALAACGGSKTTTSTTTTIASAAPTTEAQREQSALPMAAATAIPKDLNCGAVKPVWVNLNTKAYHTSDDPYYGKTKNGKYECPSAAVADGYHAAGAGRHHKGASATASP
ncbi:MAG TPA: hypothetical protein VIG46_03490 [Candidatus Baltobacteraceae bacterium]|jgi:hypothetical protein